MQEENNQPIPENCVLKKIAALELVTLLRLDKVIIISAIILPILTLLFNVINVGVATGLVAMYAIALGIRLAIVTKKLAYLETKYAIPKIKLNMFAQNGQQ
jgi:membrane protein YdbS with pleckstrin-like domain